MSGWWLAVVMGVGSVSWGATGAGHTGTPVVHTGPTGGTGAYPATHTGWTDHTGTTAGGHSGGSGGHSAPSTDTDTDTDKGTDEPTDSGDDKSGPCTCGTAGPDPLALLAGAAIVAVRRRRSDR